MLNQEAKFLDRISYAREFENTLDYPPSEERRWVVAKGRPWPIGLSDGQYIYVVLPQTGEIRFSQKPRPLSRIHHPELCHGQEVIGAGLFTVKAGEVTAISNESGHYGPDGLSLGFVRLAFEYYGSPLAKGLKLDDRWEVYGNQ